jgi:hypothetical protein
MQRRAAAAYVAFFVIVAVGAYAVIATAESPHAEVTAAEAEHNLEETGQNFSVGDRTYNVTELSASEGSGGGHGGGGVEYSAVVTWTNESAVQSTSWAANSTVSYENSTYRVLIDDVASPQFVQLRPEPPDDVNPHWMNDSQFVSFDVDDDGFVERDVPVERYLSQEEERESVAFTASSGLNDTHSVRELTNESVVLEWIGPEENDVELNQKSVVELNGEEYFVYLTGGSGDAVARLDDNSSTKYYERKADADLMELRTNGFWAVVIVSGSAAFLIIGLAFMPSKS